MNVVLKQIHKHFGPVRANDGISLELGSGRIYGLLGENGAGKSTLMKILSGYHQPDSGEIELAGHQVEMDSPAEALARGVGMIYQDPLDVPSMRVVENFLLGRPASFRLDFRAAAAELKERAAMLGFSVDPQAHIDSLTLGERQQLELLRMLAQGAQVLILDEPTTGISAEQKEMLFSSLRRLAQEEGKTVILVSHKLQDVQELCSQVFVLRRGKLVGQAAMPASKERLVQMMFDEVPPRRPRQAYARQDLALELRSASIEGEHLHLESIELSLLKGEVLGLAGLEGSGQRLVMQACAGLQHVRHGQVLIWGEDVSRWSFHRLQDYGVAYLPAGRLEEGLVAGLSLQEHVTLASPGRRFFIDGGRFRRETRARIEQYRIVGQPETRVEMLSGGNQQRALFALLRSPLKLLLLEHPTRGLDVRSSEWIWELMLERVQQGSSIVFISADLDELIERSDWIVSFSGGVMSRKVAASETSAEELGHMIGGEA